MRKTDLTADELRMDVLYDPETGIFVWARNRHKVKAGSVAGGVDSQGYVRLRLGSMRGKYAAHRLAFLYMTGEWPKDEVDHANGMRSDNRWSNLREATKAQNLWNQGKRVTNKTGCPGVHWQGRLGRYVSYIRQNGRRIHLGCSDDIFEAAAKSMSAKNRLHGEFANHG